jgi:shikimate dehydrogenase
MAKELNFKQELTACFGFPVSENPTQAMMEPAYVALSLDWRYLTLEVPPASLSAAVAGARAFGFQGFNCTIPHKIAVIEHLDGLGESASLMGAVNCVVNRDGQFIGENTDGKGFVSSLKEVTDPTGKTVVIFGAGGASRAISVELALAGATEITIVNRDPDRGQTLVDLLNSKVNEVAGGGLSAKFVQWDGDYQIPSDSQIVINATSIGLFPDIDARLALDISTLSSEMIVADVIPNPPKTNLVKDATAADCKVIDGLEMLVAQGVIGIEYWTGKSPDAKIMRQALEDVFG